MARMMTLSHATTALGAPLPPYVQMVVTHMNAPYGPLIQADHLRRLFAAKTIRALDAPPFQEARDILASLFTQCTPEMIGTACIELGYPLDNAHALYLDLVAHGEPTNWKWERAMKGVVVP